MDNLPNFKIGANYYSAQQIVDKTLYARKPVVLYMDNNQQVTIPKGQYIGKVFSWATIGGLKFLLYGPYSTSYRAVFYDPLAFAESAIVAQGGLTVEEEAQAAADANKSAFEKFLDSLGITNIGNTIKWAVPVLIIGSVGIALYKQKNKADSYKQIRSSNENK